MCLLSDEILILGVLNVLEFPHDLVALHWIGLQPIGIVKNGLNSYVWQGRIVIFILMKQTLFEIDKLTNTFIMQNGACSHVDVSRSTIKPMRSHTPDCPHFPSPSPFPRFRISYWVHRFFCALAQLSGLSSIEKGQNKTRNVRVFYKLKICGISLLF